MSIVKGQSRAYYLPPDLLELYKSSSDSAGHVLSNRRMIYFDLFLAVPCLVSMFPVSGVFIHATATWTDSPSLDHILSLLLHGPMWNLSVTRGYALEMEQYKSVMDITQASWPLHTLK